MTVEAPWEVVKENGGAQLEEVSHRGQVLGGHALPGVIPHPGLFLQPILLALSTEEQRAASTSCHIVFCRQQPPKPANPSSSRLKYIKWKNGCIYSLSQKLGRVLCLCLPRSNVTGYGKDGTKDRKYTDSQLGSKCLKLAERCLKLGSCYTFQEQEAGAQAPSLSAWLLWGNRGRQQRTQLGIIAHTLRDSSRRVVCSLKPTWCTV